MKNSKKKGPELTNEEIQFLTCNTRYDDKEVREWFRYKNVYKHQTDLISNSHYISHVQFTY